MIISANGREKPLSHMKNAMLLAYHDYNTLIENQDAYPIVAEKACGSKLISKFDSYWPPVRSNGDGWYEYW